MFSTLTKSCRHVQRLTPLCPRMSAAAARYKTSSTKPAHSTITPKGSVLGVPLSLSHNLDFTLAFVGQTIEVPYETTFSSAASMLWQSTFQIHDRLYTSTPFAQSINLQAHVLPFYMMLFKCISMSHVDESRNVLDLGFSNAVYVNSAFENDTFKQTFIIRHLRATSDGKNAIMTVGCELHNQRGQLVFSCDKTMLYPNATVPAHKFIKAPDHKLQPPNSHLFSHILNNRDNLPTNTYLADIVPGQLILHTVSRPIGTNTNMQLSTFFRWVHPTIYNVKKYSKDELLVPGGLVLASTISATSRGLFETLHESMEYCSFLERVSPVDLISAISYVESVRSVGEGLEEIGVVTLGLKNIDPRVELHGVELPIELFTQQLHKKEMDGFVAKYAPLLNGKIVVQVKRTIIRQSPMSQHRSIPLL